MFGGTFDPIHNAHLSVATAAAQRCGLDRVLFVPSWRPPHRQEGTYAAYEDRYQMVEIACRQDARFEPSRVEEGQSPSYTMTTVERARPDYLIIGADAFAEIASWHRWRDLIAAVTFIVVSRPGATYSVPDGARVERLEEVQLEISSSEIRQNLAHRKFDIPVPPAVEEYILTHQLYSSS